MMTIAETLLATTPLGVTAALPRAGTWLENAYVYDSAAREIKAQAQRGRVEIVKEVAAPAESGGYISHIEFKRLR